MDSRQSATKRSFEENPLQNEDDDDMPSTSKGSGDGVKAKLLKQELDPLRIGHILEKVFSYLDVDSTKNAREVNKFWCIEGSKSLMNKCYVQIPRDADGLCNEMNAFKEFLSLKSSDQSMIPNITIETFSDFDLWNALGVLGLQVKAIKLKKIEYNTKLLHKVLDFLPRLKSLNFQVDWLYNDKIISILKSVQSKVEKVGTALIISKLTLQAENMTEFEIMEEFSNCNNIMVEDLKLVFNSNLVNEVPDWEDRLVSTLNKLLSTNQNVLKRLALNKCQVFLSLLEFPCMSALTHLHMDLNLYSENPVQMSRFKFPPSFRFSENIPNLQEICIDTANTDYWSYFLEHALENAGPAPSVKRVKYLHNNTTHVAFLFKMFPNVEDLQISVYWNFLMEFESLWTLGIKLRKLRLTVNDFCLYVHFDSIFTGFTPETVQRIKKHQNLAPYSMEKLEKLRVNLSLYDLKELEHIIIDLDCNSWPLNLFLPKRMLTIAEKHTLRLLPKKPQLTVYVKEGSNPVAADAAMESLDEVSQLANVSVHRI